MLGIFEIKNMIDLFDKPEWNIEFAKSIYKEGYRYGYYDAVYKYKDKNLNDNIVKENVNGNIYYYFKTKEEAELFLD